MTLALLGVALPWLIVAIGCWIGLQLVRQNGRILLRLEALERRLAQPPVPPVNTASQSASAPALAAPQAQAGLSIGSIPPEFELPDLSGTPRSLSDWRGRRLLLVFFNPQCGYCVQMLPELAARFGHDSDVEPLVVSTGDAEQNRKLMREHAIAAPVLLQRQMEVAARYQVNGTPMGYLIDRDGTIASPLAVGSRALLDLVPATHKDTSHVEHKGNRTLADSRIKRDGLEAGTPAPGFRLPRVGGGELALEQYRGHPVLLVFSDPNCGPCDQLAPQLERLHRQRRDLQILMVSRGDEEANEKKIKQSGLTFPVVLQRSWEISRAYAMFATPIGYLIDEHGVVAADVAVGADPILALAQARVAAEKEVATQ